MEKETEKTGKYRREAKVCMDFFGRILSNSPEDADEFGQPDTISTLDEPVWKTILRDLADIGLKTLHVIFPFWGSFKRVDRLKDWDLWGPLLLSFILASVLTLAAGNQATLIFTTVFIIVWLGSTIITVNAILLGGKVSFFQTVCALGYSLGPLDIAALICIWWDNIIFRTVVVLVCWAWSVFGMPFSPAGPPLVFDFNSLASSDVLSIMGIRVGHDAH